MSHRPTARLAPLLSLALGLAALAAPGGAAAQVVNQVRTQVFLAPADPGSAPMANRLEGMVASSLNDDVRFRLVDLQAILRVPEVRDLAGERMRARGHMERGISLFEKSKHKEAVAEFKKAVAIYDANAGWIHQIPEYQTTLGYLAAAQTLGDSAKEGRATYRQLIFLDDFYEVDQNRFEPSLQQVLEKERDALAGAPVGNLTLTSEPTGARVYLDGQHRGYTPLNLDMVQVGTHVVRFEARGAGPWGKVLTVGTRELKVHAPLALTPDSKDLSSAVAIAAGEMGGSAPGPTMLKIAKECDLTWAVYGTVFHSKGRVTINAWVIDASTRQLIVAQREAFSDNEAALVQTMRVFMRDLLAKAWRVVEDEEQAAAARDRGNAREKKKSKDPLDNISGMEDWGGQSDQAGGRRGDPLREMEGTDDW